MKDKKIRLAISGMILLVIVAGVAFKDTVSIQVSAKNYIAKALKNTKIQVGKETLEKQERMGVMDLSKEEAVQTSLEMKLKKLIGDDASYANEMLKNTKLNVMTTRSKAQYLTEAEFKTPQIEGIKLEAYWDDTQVGVRLKQFFDTFLMLPTEEFVEAFNASELRNVMDMETLADNTELKAIDFKETEIYKEFNEMVKSFEKEITIEYIGNDKINGVKCRKFEINIPEDTLKDLLSEGLDIILSDDTFESILINMIVMDGYYTREEARQEIKDLKKEFRDALKEIKINDGLVMTLHINNKKQVVSLVNEMTLKNEYDEKIQLQTSVMLGGSKALTDLVELEGLIKVDGEKITASMTCESNLGDKENLLTQKATIRVSENANTLIKGTLETSYDSKEKEDNYTVDVKYELVDELQMKINGLGTITQDKKEKRYNCSLDEFKVELTNMYYMETVGVELEVAYETQPISVTDLTPDRTKNIFKMSSDEIWELEREIQFGAMSFFSSLGKY